MEYAILIAKGMTLEPKLHVYESLNVNTENVSL